MSIAAVNPSLTIIANALRVGDHLLEDLGNDEQRNLLSAMRKNTEIERGKRL